MQRRSPPGNLPAPATPLIGRAGELAELREALAHHRLVTIAGVGGVGKTRAALELARLAGDRFSDGVWFAQLESLADRRLVAQTIAAPFSGKVPLGENPFASLAGILEKKVVLLVVDGCEHLVDGVAKLAVTLLHRCPGVTLLTTSRVPLDIAGETIYRLPALALPPESSGLGARTAGSYDSVALFVARASHKRSTFRLTDRNVDAVVEICRRVDGIPLAVEIAAAHMHAIAPEHLAEKLGERFQTLRRGSRTPFSRQQTMQALMEWSYELLDEPARALFARASTFAGAWTQRDAIAVCRGSALDAKAVPAILGELVAKALVVRDEEAKRFRLLEPLRDFAAACLRARGEVDWVARAHGEHFLALLIAGGARPLMPRSRTWMASIDAALPDVRRALDWAIGEGRELVQGARAALAFHEYAERRNMPEEALRYLTAVRVAATALDPMTRLDVRIAEGNATVDFGLSAPDIAAIVAEARALGDPRAMACALSLAIHVQAFAGETIERGLVEEALDHANTSHDAYLLGRIIGLGGFLSGVPPERTRDCFEEAIAKLAPFEDTLCSASLHNNWSEFEYEEGDFGKALQLAEAAHRIASHEPGLERIAVMVDVNRAMYAIAANQLDRATTHALDALAATRGLRDSTYAMLGLCAMLHLARVADRTERADVAARIVGYVEEALTAQHITLQFHERQQLDALLSSLRSSLGIEGFSVRAMEGAGWNASQAVDEIAAAFAPRVP